MLVTKRCDDLHEATAKVSLLAFADALNVEQRHRSHGPHTRQFSQGGIAEDDERRYGAFISHRPAKLAQRFEQRSVDILPGILRT